MTRICRNNDYNMGDNPFSLHHVDVNSNSVFARILIGIRHSKLDEIDIIYYFQEIRHRSYLEDTNINHILNVIECTVNKPCTNIARIEKDSKTDMIYLMTEDKIDRYDLRIVRPHKEHSTSNTGYFTNRENYILKGDGKKAMLTSGPILNMEIITIKLRGSNEESFTVQITASKGKKDVFHEEILVSKIDAMRLNRFINKNLSMKISKFPN